MKTSYFYHINSIIYSYLKDRSTSLKRDSLPSHCPSLHGSCIVASMPEQLVSLAASHEHKAPPAGAGLSQYLNFCFIPGPQTSLHLEKWPSLHPPSTIIVLHNIHEKGGSDPFLFISNFLFDI